MTFIINKRDRIFLRKNIAGNIGRTKQIKIYVYYIFCSIASTQLYGRTGMRPFVPISFLITVRIENSTRTT